MTQKKGRMNENEELWVSLSLSPLFLREAGTVLVPVVHRTRKILQRILSSRKQLKI